jgi:hypothetical protein
MIKVIFISIHFDSILAQIEGEESPDPIFYQLPRHNGYGTLDKKTPRNISRI